MALAELFFVAALAASAWGLQHENLFPEGVDWDEKHSRFLIGSMGFPPSIYAVAEGNATQLELFVRDEQGYAGERGYVLVGIRVDPPRNRVLAVVSNSKQGFQALAAYDLKSKERTLFARLDHIIASENQQPQANDVAVDSRGNAYVTNSKDNFVWKVEPGGNVSVFTADDLLSSQPRTVTSPDDPAAVCGLNGIAYHQRDDILLVDQTNTGALFRVDLATAKVSLVQLSQPLTGCDGIALRKDGALVVVSASKVWLLSSSDRWRSGRLEDTIDLDPSSCFPTAVAIQKGYSIHVVCSHLTDYFRGNPRREFELQQLEFPKDSLNDPIWLLLLLALVVVLVLAWRFQMGHFFNEYKRKRF